MLDLKEIEQKIDNLVANETPEEMMEFIKKNKMKKLENIEQACRALAELHPEKFIFFQMPSPFEHESRFGMVKVGTKLINESCACDFDSILELVGLEYLIKRLSGSSCFFWEVYDFKGTNIEADVAISFDTKKQASEAAFIAAVRWLVDQKKESEK